MFPFDQIKKAYNNHYRPQTVTVKIPVGWSWSKDYCEITYIANDAVTREIALAMAENGRDIAENGPNLSTTKNLLIKERELGLKRHNTKDKQGRIIPAVKHVQHLFGMCETYEHWKRGGPATLFGVHKYSITNGLVIEPADGDSCLKMEEGYAKEAFIAKHKLYYGGPSVASA